MDKPPCNIFTLMLEPVKACNIHCRYCYSDLADQGVMSFEIVAAAIHEAVAYARENRFGSLHLIWHGGEPLLAGLDFFRAAGAEIAVYGSDIPIQQFIQTNGLLLDKDFCRFFKNQRIEVGISLDGPKKIHDAMRITRGGEGTHDQIMEKLVLAKTLGLPFGLCMVVTPHCLGREKEIYHFFKAMGTPFRANPVIPPFRGPYGGNVLLERGEYGRFMCRLFDEWIKAKAGRVPVSPLDSYLLGLVSGASPECQHQASCIGNRIGVRPDGTLVLCSRFQVQCLGHIRVNALREIFNTATCTALDRRSSSLRSCRACINREICHGGCPHNAVVFSGDTMTRDPLCTDYQMIYDHIRKGLDEERHGAA
jgi:uncharacterized protein